MMWIKVILTSMLIGLISQLNAQTIFSKVYSDMDGYMSATSLVTTPDSGFLIAGSWYENASWFKVDTGGNANWIKGIRNETGPAFLNITDVAATRDSMFILLGAIYTEHKPYQELLLVKIDQSGDTLWTRIIDFGSGINVNSINPLNDGGYIISGQVFEGPFFTPRLLIVKVDQNGYAVWSNICSPDNFECYAHSVIQASDNSLFVSGFFQYNSAMEVGPLLMKLTPEGQIIWTKTYEINTSPYYIATDIILSNDGLYLSLYPTSWETISIMKTDFNGNGLWCKKYNSFSGGNPINVKVPSLQMTKDSSLLFLASFMWGPGELFKTDKQGFPVLKKGVFLIGSQVVGTSDHGLFITGNGPIYGVKSSAIVDPHIGVIRTDEEGNGVDCIWPLDASYTEASINYSAMNFVSTPAMVSYDQDTLILLEGIPNIEDGCVTFLGGLEEPDAEIQDIQVIPNPNNGIFSIKKAEGMQLFNYEIFNSMGKLISEGDINLRSSGCIDLTNQPDGIYFLRGYSPLKIYSASFIIRH